MKKPLIYRSYGGLGDIIQHRFLFEAFYKKYGSCSFACPSIYHPVLLNHPFLNEIISSENLNLCNFEVFNTDNVCRISDKITRGKISRLDVWSKILKVKLSQNPSSYLERCVKPVQFEQNYCVVCPVSAYSEKDLIPEQLLPVLSHLGTLGLRVFGLHSSAVPWLEEAGYSVLKNLPLADWLNWIAGASLVLTAETAAVHAAGCLGVPFVAVCGSGNGSVICRQYRGAVVQSSADCSPCGFPLGCPFAGSVKPCISSISSEEIISAVASQLERNS